MPHGKPFKSLIPPDWPLDVQPTDESGNVDLSLIDYNLSLTLDERIAQHYRARLLVQQAREAGRRLYGHRSAHSNPVADE